MSKANARISLGDVNIKIMDRGKAHDTVAQVYLNLLPSPQQVLECEVQGMLSFNDRAPSITLLQYHTDLEVMCISWQYKEGVSKLTFTPKTEPCTVVKQEGKRLQIVTFDVLNFPSFIGQQDITEECTTERGGAGVRRRGRVELEADGWRIEVTAVPDLKEIVDALKGQGGYAVTHKGNLKRSDGETFSIEDAENAMNRLWQFLSFARGQYCSPILPVGFNCDGEVVWRQWGCRTVESWGEPLSWFDRQHAEALGEVFPGFWNCLNGVTHAAAARIALEWYLRSNRNNGDQAGGLILSQTALERLADVHGLKKKRGESVAMPIRQLMNKIGIPPELPGGFSVLKEVLRALTTKDGGGPEALVAVRNDLVHPKEKLAEISGLKEYEAWNLAQWYLELILLNMFGFKGKYGNRTLEGRWTGQVESIPWAPKSD